MLSPELIKTIRDRRWEVQSNDDEVTITFTEPNKYVFSSTFKATDDKEFIDYILGYVFDMNAYLRKELSIEDPNVKPDEVFFHYQDIREKLIYLSDFVWDYAEKSGSPSKDTIRSYWEFEAFKIDDDDKLEIVVNGPLRSETFCIKNYRGRLERVLDKLVKDYDPAEETKRVLKLKEDVDFESYICNAFDIENALENLAYDIGDA